MNERLTIAARAHASTDPRTVPADVPVTKLLSRGSIADALLEHTRNGPWDLLVVGLRGADRRARRRRAGTRVLRASSIPVLVVRSPSTPGSDAKPVAPAGPCPPLLRIVPDSGHRGWL